ncbi:hypothetical protein L204_106313 [Cryptococcus depauperatus]
MERMKRLVWQAHEAYAAAYPPWRISIVFRDKAVLSDATSGYNCRWVRTASMHLKQRIKTPAILALSMPALTMMGSESAGLRNVKKRSSYTVAQSQAGTKKGSQLAIHGLNSQTIDEPVNRRPFFHRRTSIMYPTLATIVEQPTPPLSPTSSQSQLAASIQPVTPGCSLEGSVQTVDTKASFGWRWWLWGEKSKHGSLGVTIDDLPNVSQPVGVAESPEAIDKPSFCYTNQQPFALSVMDVDSDSDSDKESSRWSDTIPPEVLDLRVYAVGSNPPRHGENKLNVLQALSTDPKSVKLDRVKRWRQNSYYAVEPSRLTDSSSAPGTIASETRENHSQVALRQTLAQTDIKALQACHM